MADNVSRYGFRFFGLNGGNGHVKPNMEIVATAASFDVSGGIQNAALRAGDVVTRASTGGVTLCGGGENSQTPVNPFGVIVGVLPYYDSTIGLSGAMRFTGSLPSDISWGTNLARQSKLLVMPFMPGQIWEVDADENTTATTEAAYQAFIGENVTMINTGAASTTPPWARPKLFMSTHATTATLCFRIRGISPTLDNVDFSGANVKLLVEANISQNPAYSLIGTGALGV
jgi:hypothetical protein